MRPQTTGWAFLALIVCSSILPILAFPSGDAPLQVEGRKFAVKPNNNKKIALESNEITPANDNGFSWINILTTLIQMFLGGSGIDKADTTNQGGFNWMQLVSLGMRLLASAMGSDSGVDKSDNGGGINPVQLIQIVTSLLDALKVSFSQRSSQARSLGSRDTIADAGIAAVSIVKGYVSTYKTKDEVCMQKMMCQANKECVKEANEAGYIFCQLGTYAAGYALEKTSYTPLDIFADAGRRGRTGEDCSQIFVQCNEL